MTGDQVQDERRSRGLVPLASPLRGAVLSGLRTWDNLASIPQRHEVIPMEYVTRDVGGTIRGSGPGAG